MSSFIGHGLVAVCAHSAVAPQRRPFTSRWGAWAWLGWLIVVAWAPDIDHVIPALKMSQNDGMRISHALASSLLLPVLTSAALYVVGGLRGRRWRISSLQAMAVGGVSHCDGLVGGSYWPAVALAVLFTDI